MATTSEAARPVTTRVANVLGSGSSPARIRVALLVVVLGFVALASFVAAKTPAWESSDEPGHVLNIETIVSGHWYGIPGDCRPDPRATLVSCEGDEAQQAPLYYLLMAGWQEISGQGAHHPSTLLRSNPNWASAQEFFLNHPSDWGLLLWLRLGNVLLGAATVVMAFLAARLVARDQWTPVIAAALVAFIPRFVFLSAFVTNDNLVIFLGSVLTFCALRFSKSTTTGWMIATGAVYGLLVTTKLSTVPLALLVPFLAFIGSSAWRRRWSLLGYGAVSALVVCGWYLVQNWVRYGDPLARQAALSYDMRIGSLGLPIGVPYVIKDPLDLVLFNVPSRIASNVWYSSGWGQFHWSLTVGVLITLAVAVVLLGLIYQPIPLRTLLLLAVISVLSLSCVWFMAFQTPAYGDRFAYVGVTAMAALLALALQRWPLVLRWLWPAAGVAGCVIAIHQNVLGVHWTT